MLDFAIRENVLNNEIEVIRTGIIDVSMIDMLKEFPEDYGVQRLKNKGNISRIKHSMQELYVPSVIKVNKDWYILDGAHSKEAIKQLALEGVQIVYVMYDTKGRDREICIKLNTTSKQWDNKDYLKIWCEAGKDDYIWFNNFINRYNLSFQSAILLATGKTAGRMYGEPANIVTYFKNGTMEISQSNRSRAINIAEQIMDIEAVLPKEVKGQRSLHNGFVRIATNEQYDHNRMLSKLSYQRDRVYRCSSQNGYIEMLEGIYNYKTRDKVYFTSK